MIREILLIHHTHTDIGYTHPQPVVFELHRRFLDEALDLADATRDDPEPFRFKWVCELAGMTRRWWDAASTADQLRFRQAVLRGQLEIAAAPWHMTPLVDDRMLLRGMRHARFFRDLGLPVRFAMHTDVNGVPWGMVDALLDHEVEGFSMAINGHWGGAPERPRAFWWESPSGRRLLTWNGYQYWQMAAGHLRIPSGLEEVGQALAKVLPQVEAGGYSHDFLPLQITTAHHPDNAGPDAGLTAFLERWAETRPEVALRLATYAEVFERFRQLDLPTHRGDWTDYWNFGAGSTARATVLLREGQLALDAANVLAALPGAAAMSPAYTDAEADLELYAEHTWGADCSIGEPDSAETFVQGVEKVAMAARGFSMARMARRDGLVDLAARSGGEGPRLLLLNPNPTPVARRVAVPMDSALDWYLNPGSMFPHRYEALASAPKDPVAHPDRARYVWAELPAYGYRSYPLSELPVPPTDGVSFDEAHGRTVVTQDGAETVFDARGGGVVRLAGKDVPRLPLAFGVPVVIELAEGDRRSAFALDFSRLEPAECWRYGWRENRRFGRLVEADTVAADGCVRHRQRFDLGEVGNAELTYRFFAGEPGIELEIVVDHAGVRRPHGLFLPLTVPEAASYHFDTAGAEVEFDRETLPGASRHYVTTNRWVRASGTDGNLTVAASDLPLWTFGGLAFAREWPLAESEACPSLVAWLSNNLWDTNFAADQRGKVRNVVRLFPAGPENLADSLARIGPFLAPVVEHPYVGPGGPASEGCLLRCPTPGIVLSSVERRPEGLFLAARNVSDQPAVAHLISDSGAREAWACNLAGRPIERLESLEGGVALRLSAREWKGVLFVDDPF